MLVRDTGACDTGDSEIQTERTPAVTSVTFVLTLVSAAFTSEIKNMHSGHGTHQPKPKTIALATATLNFCFCCLFLPLLLFPPPWCLPLPLPPHHWTYQNLSDFHATQSICIYLKYIQLISVFKIIPYGFCTQICGSVCHC